MNVQEMINRLKAHPDYHKAGMILCHNGVVRATSREGEEVTGLKVTVNHKRLKEIVDFQSNRPGIVDVIVEITEEKELPVGEDVMYIVVGGDIRENVIAVLTETLNQVKAEVTSKTQFFK
ncbi:MAG: molybdenum cofactor biosynthesis protein MoaE [Desulfobacterium sp.]